MSGNDKSRLLNALTLAPTRRIPKAGFGAPVGDNTVDRLGLEGPGTQQVTDNLKFLGYHGACVGDIASMHAGVDPGKTGENWPEGQYKLPGFYIAERFDTAKMFAEKRGEKIPPAYTGIQRHLAVVEVFIPKCVFLPEKVIPVLESPDDDTDDFDLLLAPFQAIPSISSWTVPRELTPWTGGSFSPKEGSGVRRTIRDYNVLGVRGSIKGYYSMGDQIFIARVGCQWLRFGNARLI